MVYHRYPPRKLIREYVTAAIGFTVVVVPIVFGGPGPFFFAVLSAVAALFFVYGVRTLALQLTAYELRTDGIASHGPRRRFFAWADITGIRLRYYSTQRDKSQRDLKSGWLELRITGPAGKLRIDSTVSGFDEILVAAADAARARQLELDEMTKENLTAFQEGKSPPPPESGVSDDDMRF
jgi:hypothetical protein